MTPEQEAAMARFLSTSWPLGIERLDRDEIYAERLDGIGRGADR
jgi:hypothetical protein